MPNLQPFQAQFIISPDRLFAEKGATSKIKYHDRFTQYKKLIIKNINSPQMKLLMSQLNTQLFQARPQVDQISPTDRQEESEEDDIFSRAFQEQVTLSNFYYYPNSARHPHN